MIHMGAINLILYKIYSANLKHLEIEEGFFEGWPNPPSIEKHKQILANSYKAIVAIDGRNHKIIGFINAISDGILSAYIPLLEVLPQYQKQGIGSGLVRRILEELDGFYMIDLSCDKELQSFYEKLGMIKSHGMVYRNYKYQCGKNILNK